MLSHIFILEDLLSVECDVVCIDDLNLGEAGALQEQSIIVGVAEIDFSQNLSHSY